MKKLKLALSICMMCLSIAVLCMGILAASSATYNINGNISYNMVDGVALINTRVYKVAGTTTETDLSTSCTTLSTMTFETIEQTSGYVLSQKLDTKATLSDGATSSELSAGSINIGFGATDSSVYYYTFYIVVNITNLTDAGVLSATLTDNTTYASTITKVVNTSQMTTIEKGDTKNIVMGLSIPSTTNVEVYSTINCSITVSFSKYQCTLDSATIYFTKDMTWAEYVATLSDSSSFDVSGEYLLYNSKNVRLNSTKVAPDDTMISGGTYILMEGTITFTIYHGETVFWSGTCESGTTWSTYVSDNESTLAVGGRTSIQYYRLWTNGTYLFSQKSTRQTEIYWVLMDDQSTEVLSDDQILEKTYYFGGSLYGGGSK